LAGLHGFGEVALRESGLQPRRSHFLCEVKIVNHGFGLGLPFVFCHSASRRCISSFETVNIVRTA
jgi:hypothetical protein